jgi:hypothetical protein
MHGRRGGAQGRQDRRAARRGLVRVLLCRRRHVPAASEDIARLWAHRQGSSREGVCVCVCVCVCV